MTRSSSYGKFFHVAFIIAWIVGLPISLHIVYNTLRNQGWGTVSFNCQPNSVQVLCQIARQPQPGTVITEKILKTQLTGVKVRFNSGTRGRTRTVVLTTIDGREIAFVDQGGGIINTQLESQLDLLAGFIADPQAQTLNVETHPDPMGMMIPGGITCLFLYYIAFGSLRAVILDLKKIR
jgi:hypothetical protein